ncbi:hypothetical protein PINS_up014819 [Pythium insidiosum]|nr:hypothetical protein PINS_up014819 [Pythium insidiosum]
MAPERQPASRPPQTEEQQLQRPQEASAATPQASNAPIDLIDSDEEIEDASGPALFQSRRFPEITFHASDFMTIQDGLNVARRSGLVYCPPPTPPTPAMNGNAEQANVSTSAPTPTPSELVTASTAGADEAAPVPSSSTKVSETAAAPPTSSNQNISSTADRSSEADTTNSRPATTEAEQPPPRQPAEALVSPPRTVKKEETAAKNPPPPPTSQQKASEKAQIVHTLQPRRKHPTPSTQSSTSPSAPSPVSVSSTSRSASPASINRVPSAGSPLVRNGATPPLFCRRIGLGHCGSDFLEFTKNSVDGEDEDDEDDDEDDDDADDEEEEARAKLLEVVDLTNLSDESADDDDEEDDDDDDSGFEIVTPTVSSISSLYPQLSTAGSAQRVLMSVARQLSAPSSSSGAVPPVGASALPVAPVVKKRRAPRPKETCLLCEEKGWIRSLVHCATCKKYYHKRCAREFGDAEVCWNCDLDGMIDDSELTDGQKEEVVSMFSTLRQSSSDSEDDESKREDGDEDLSVDPQTMTQPEDKSLNGEIGRAVTAALQSQTTRSMRRWKEFLEKATATVDAQFEATTSRIQAELEQPTERARYSKGFASREAMEQAMAQVMDHYAELQEREERTRGVTLEAIADGDSEPASSADHTPLGSALAMELDGATTAQAAASTTTNAPPAATSVERPQDSGQVADEDTHNADSGQQGLGDSI